jgi:MarR family transcriptional repressor of emrRAB
MNSQLRIKHEETESYVAAAHERAAGEALGDIRISILIRHNNGLMMDLLNRNLAPYKLSSVSYFAMMMLFSRANNLANPSELCDATGETRGNMTRICDELVDKGLMRRVTNMEDRRRVDLSLTDEGMTLLQTAVPALRAKAKTVFDSFSEEEKSTLFGLLLRLKDVLESKL